VNGKTRDVAIKQQKEDPNRDPKLKVMEGDFITEGHVQAGLNHPNVVAQIGIVFSDHDPLANRHRLIVLELVKGGELHDFLERRQHRPTEVEEITDMLRCVGCRLLERVGVGERCS
jgi:serine/threonine protein kinase